MINKEIAAFIDFIKSKDGIGDKTSLIDIATKKFNFTKDRSVYYTKHFAVRFSFSTSSSFSNTVISLSNLQKYDDQPFIVCLITPTKNILYLANTTFIKKVSHSSQQLRLDNIRGSINGSDIVKEFNGIANTPDNFEKLFSIHAELGFDGNLPRLVEATTGIIPSGHKFEISQTAKNLIKEAPARAIAFVQSKEYELLKTELDEKVKKYKTEILIAGFIENVNIRGRIIEYLIAGEDEKLRQDLVRALHESHHKIPGFKTNNTLADYVRIFDEYNTATDIKTKIMVLNSNPKAYNIDKMLEFLAKEKTVFMFYFIGLEPNKIVNQILISMFQTDLLKSTILLKHWSGRNSRGVTQFEGETIHKLLLSNGNNEIDLEESKNFLERIINF